MSRYLLCTQQDWGEAVFDRVRKESQDEWSMLRRPSGDGYSLSDHLLHLHLRLNQHVDKAFFVHWSDRVSPQTLALTECINFHCTPLPYGRGGNPIENMILRGHTETTMTAYRMTDEIDAGPTYFQVSGISLCGTKTEILARFINPVATLIEQIAWGWMLPACPQEGEVVKFSRLSDADYQTFWAARGGL